MSYDQINFKDGSTPLDASNFNKMDAQIAANADVIDALANKFEAIGDCSIFDITERRNIMSDYKKQDWVDKETTVDAEHLNHMEDGIADAGETADSALETAESAITGITLNGEDVPVEDNIAGITFDDVSNGSGGIKALTVDGDLFDYVNDVCDTIGVYFMRATSDTPNIPETAAFFIMLLRNSNTQATMLAFRAGSNTNTYMCKEQSGTWGDWTQIIPSGGA